MREDAANERLIELLRAAADVATEEALKNRLRRELLKLEHERQSERRRVAWDPFDEEASERDALILRRQDHLRRRGLGGCWCDGKRRQR